MRSLCSELCQEPVELIREPLAIGVVERRRPAGALALMTAGHASASTQMCMRGLLSGEKPPGQQRLHVAPAVGDQRDEYTSAVDVVDDPVGLEEGLTVFADTQGQELGRARAP